MSTVVSACLSLVSVTLNLSVPCRVSYTQSVCLPSCQLDSTCQLDSICLSPVVSFRLTCLSPVVSIRPTVVPFRLNLSVSCRVSKTQPVCLLSCHLDSTCLSLVVSDSTCLSPVGSDSTCLSPVVSVRLNPCVFCRVC